LHHELGDVEAEFANFQKTDLAKVNDTLKAKQIDPIDVPAAAPAETGGGKGGGEKKRERFENPFERD
jgi:hypothetical protein